LKLNIIIFAFLSFWLSGSFVHADIIAGIDFGSERNNQFMIALVTFFLIAIFLLSFVVTKLDERVKQKSIHLEANYNEVLENVNGDKSRIQHFISSLLSNAIKFTGDSGNIFIKTWQDDENYFISIEDDGIGIEPDEFEETFDKFYTGSNVPKGKGTGLGLSLVKIFIEKHGGNIMVESSLGVGTEMTCKLPKKPPVSVELSSPDNLVEINQLPI